MRRIITALFLLLLLFVGSSFFWLNATPAELNYYYGVARWPLAHIMVTVFAVGAIAGLLGGMGVVLRCKREISRLKRSLKSNERELSQLKVLPEQK